MANSDPLLGSIDLEKVHLGESIIQKIELHCRRQWQELWLVIGTATADLSAFNDLCAIDIRKDGPKDGLDSWRERENVLRELATLCERRTHVCVYLDATFGAFNQQINRIRNTFSDCDISNIDAALRQLSRICTAAIDYTEHAWVLAYQVSMCLEKNDDCYGDVQDILEDMRSANVWMDKKLFLEDTGVNFPDDICKIKA